MSRRPARFMQSDVEKALRVALKMDPPWIVEIAPDGSIQLVPAAGAPEPSSSAADPAEVALANWLAGRNARPA